MKRFSVVIVALIVACGAYFLLRQSSLLQTGGSGAATTAKRLPNIVFIAVDTLRADHLPFYGYSKDTAPFITKLAQESVLFERAFSPSSWTAPAMASIFTSQRPAEHGVITGFFFFKSRHKKGADIKLNVLPKAAVSLGEYFKSAGYTLFGAADNANISSTLGFSRGFSRFHTFRNRGANFVNRRAKRWKDLMLSSAPYVLFLHYMDPHAPYAERQPWYQHAEDERTRTKNAYDSEISFVDQHVQMLFEEFRWGDDTIVVFLSDHGEEFWEHGNLGHGRTLYRESIHVPFFIKLPGVKAQRISADVGTIDVLPTLGDFLGLQPAPTWRGKSLMPIINEPTGEAAIKNKIWSELFFVPAIHRTSRRSVIAESHQLIASGAKPPFSFELFNLHSDFAQTKNILGSEPDITKYLTDLLTQPPSAEVLQSDGVTITLDDKALENLKTLGYVN